MAMNGYTKLFNSIVASTIWSEPDETRIIWITMLAMADQRGLVETSIPGLAVLARVPVDKCRQALLTLESPDPDSRSQEYEGRRIRKVDGGWVVLNHGKYRAKLSADERREYKTIKQREYRSKKTPKKTPVDNCGLSSTLSTHTDTEAEAEKVKISSPTKTVGVTPAFEAFWAQFPRRVDKKEAIRAWHRNGCENRLGEILASLMSWKKTEQWQDMEKIPYPSTWLNKLRWQETPSPGGANGARQPGSQGGKLDRFEEAARAVTGRGSGLAEALSGHALHEGRARDNEGSDSGVRRLPGKPS